MPCLRRLSPLSAVALAWAAFVLACAAPCARADGLAAYVLVGELDRLSYDARAAGMGGAALAVEGLSAAAVENPATLARGFAPDFSLGYSGRSPSGPAGAAQYFLAGTPARIVTPEHFAHMYRLALQSAGPARGELTAFCAARCGRFALFGTKAGVARPVLSAGAAGGAQTVTVVGPGLEYEALGAAYALPLGGHHSLGLALRQVRMFRAQLNYTARRGPSGNVALSSDRSTVEQGLAWAAELSWYYRGRRWAAGAVLRHATAPRFCAFSSGARWSLEPSCDLGLAWRSAARADLLAADVRNAFSANGGRPVLRLGWEHRFGGGRGWRAHAGACDGRLALGLGWGSPRVAADLSFRPGRSPSASFSVGLRF